MRRTFVEELDTVCKKLYPNDILRSETDRIHAEAVKDKHHAFACVTVRKPDPWKKLTRTGLII